MLWNIILILFFFWYFHPFGVYILPFYIVYVFIPNFNCVFLTVIYLPPENIETILWSGIDIRVIFILFYFISNSLRFFFYRTWTKLPLNDWSHMHMLLNFVQIIKQALYLLCSGMHIKWLTQKLNEQTHREKKNELLHKKPSSQFRCREHCAKRTREATSDKIQDIWANKLVLCTLFNICILAIYSFQRSNTVELWWCDIHRKTLKCIFSIIIVTSFEPYKRWKIQYIQSLWMTHEKIEKKKKKKKTVWLTEPEPSSKSSTLL